MKRACSDQTVQPARAVRARLSQVEHLPTEVWQKIAVSAGLRSMLSLGASCSWFRDSVATPLLNNLNRAWTELEYAAKLAARESFSPGGPELIYQYEVWQTLQRAAVDRQCRADVMSGHSVVGPGGAEALYQYHSRKLKSMFKQAHTWGNQYPPEVKATSNMLAAVVTSDDWRRTKAEKVDDAIVDLLPFLKQLDEDALESVKVTGDYGIELYMRYCPGIAQNPSSITSDASLLRDDLEDGAFDHIDWVDLPLPDFLGFQLQNARIRSLDSFMALLWHACVPTLNELKEPATDGFKQGAVDKLGEILGMPVPVHQQIPFVAQVERFAEFLFANINQPVVENLAHAHATTILRHLPDAKRRQCLEQAFLCLERTRLADGRRPFPFSSYLFEATMERIVAVGLCSQRDLDRIRESTLRRPD